MGPSVVQEPELAGSTQRFHCGCRAKQRPARPLACQYGGRVGICVCGPAASGQSSRLPPPACCTRSAGTARDCGLSEFANSESLASEGRFCPEGLPGQIRIYVNTDRGISRDGPMIPLRPWPLKGQSPGPSVSGHQAWTRELAMFC